jgi:hypothetical protein
MHANVADAPKAAFEVSSEQRALRRFAAISTTM